MRSTILLVRSKEKKVAQVAHILAVSSPYCLQERSGQEIQGPRRKQIIFFNVKCIKGITNNNILFRLLLLCQEKKSFQQASKIAL